jgi:DNA-binding NarL/FixJ family response regulator
MRILIVDNHILFREGLASLLDSQPDFEVVGEASSVSEAIEKALDLKPDLVLFDLALPDGSGLDMLNTIYPKFPQVRFVLLTMQESNDLLFAAIRAGATGYLLKSTPITKILAALRAIERGEAAISRAMTSNILDEFRRLDPNHFTNLDSLSTLTTREIEVLEYLGMGASNQEIAENLVITENTVKVHIHNILNKLDLRNRREAGRFARSHGLGNSFTNRFPTDL